MVKEMKTIFVTSNLRFPPSSGPFLRTESVIKALSKYSEVIIYSLNNRDSIGGNPAIEFYKKYTGKIFFAPSAGKSFSVLLKRIINKISRIIFNKRIYNIGGRENDIRFLIKTARKSKANAIWLGHGGTLYDYLKMIKEKSGFVVVVDTDSVWSRFILRGLPYARDEKMKNEIMVAGKLKEEEERWGTEIADMTTAVSGFDAEYFKKFVENKEKIKILSNVLDLKNYEVDIAKPLGFKNPSIFFAGSFGLDSPMNDAVKWFVEHIFPVVKDSVPDVHFYILGSNSDTTLEYKNEPNISILGRVESVLPYLCNADAVIVPLRFESGTRFKILEAGACRRPVVSTTLGAEGIPVTNNHDIIIADDEKNFAKGIIKVIKDKHYAEMIGNNLYKLIEENFTIKNLENEISMIVKELNKENNKNKEYNL
ncbi:MAG: glycosyltransferase [Actinobacteria bacterium]|nr:glycosyltransferase [Actinomycetota bacterium]